MSEYVLFRYWVEILFKCELKLNQYEKADLDSNRQCMLYT